MPELVWDELEKRFYETGVSNGVLYVPVAGVYTTGFAWNGLTAVTQSPSGAEPNKQYADNINYVTLMSAEEFSATIECFTFPKEFLASIGIVKTANGLQIGQQSRGGFGFAWQSRKGNALDDDLGFILNLAYGLQASPSEQADNTVNDSPELKTFSFSVSSTPVAVTGFKPTAIVRVDSTDPLITADGLVALLDVLYGRGAAPTPRLPLPDEVDTLLGTIESTGATAGLPGTWAPANSTPPTTFVEANTDGVIATPATPWTVGQFVQGATAGVTGEMYWTGATWATGRAA